MGEKDRCEDDGSQDMARETGTHITWATEMARGTERSDGRKEEKREGLLCGSLSGNSSTSQGKSPHFALITDAPYHKA
jgi:hypothetical protein